MSFLSNLFGGGDNHYQAQAPIINGQQFNADIAAAQGGLNNAIGQQQQLAQALQAQSMGQGPNPAMAQLAQATGANNANQAALMASQRGAGANAGLIARQAALQGGHNQQMAAGQGATLQAQQQLAAQQALQSQQAQIAGEYGQHYGALQNANAEQNNAMTTGQLGAQNVNAGIASQNQSTRNNALGGLFGAAGSAAGGMFGGSPSPGGAGGMGGGGDLSQFAMLANKGGMAPEMPEHIAHVAHLYHGGFSFGGESYKDGGTVPGKAQVAGDSPKNDTVPAKLSPGEIVIPRHIVMGEDAPKKAAEFVAKLIDKHGKPEDEHDDFKKALSQAIKGRKK